MIATQNPRSPCPEAAPHRATVPAENATAQAPLTGTHFQRVPEALCEAFWDDPYLALVVKLSWG